MLRPVAVSLTTALIYRSLQKPFGLRHARRAPMTTAVGGGGTAAACGTVVATVLQMPPASPLLDELAAKLPSHVRGSWVEHVLAPRTDRVSLLVSEALQVSPCLVEELLHFGAIHSCPVPPVLPAFVAAGMPAAQVAVQQRMRAEAEQRAGRSSQLRTPQRLAGDVELSQHSYIRVHLNPKRFPAVYSVDWRGRIVAETREYLVVDKPHSVPAVPTVDNQLECALSCAAAAAGHPAPLYTTSRLDQCTEGVLVLGKTKEFVQLFNGLIRTEGATRKFYRALTAHPPPTGPLVHHLSIATRRPRAPAFSVAHDAPVPGSLPCELRVLEVAEVALTGAGAQQWGPAAWECVVELVTGRTHQIRAQLSAVGCPLLGDTLYQPLSSAQLRQEVLSSDPDTPLLGASGERILQEPPGGIGLQAWRLEVATDQLTGSSPAVFEAGTPWWRC